MVDVGWQKLNRRGLEHAKFAQCIESYSSDIHEMNNQAGMAVLF